MNVDYSIIDVKAVKRYWMICNSCGFIINT